MVGPHIYIYIYIYILIRYKFLVLDVVFLSSFFTTFESEGQCPNPPLPFSNAYAFYIRFL